jgi:hypothetical protein
MLVLLLSVTTFCTGNAGLREESSPTQSTPTTGRFVDSPVEGVEYRTATQSGVTDADGRFRYLPGEQVTFSIGKTVLGSSAAAVIVTPENFAATGLADQKVKNVLRFLQTIDADGTHDNGIQIKQSVRDLLAGTSIDFGQAPAAFEADNLVKAVILVARGSAVPLVAETTAVNSFLTYLFSGSYADNYGGKHVLTPTKWQIKDNWTDQTDTLVKIDGLAKYLIIQKSASDAYNPSKYQKVIFIWNPDGSFYTCTLSPFDSANAATAEAIPDTTDKANPASSGCGSFAWTKMSPVQHPLIGKWTDPFNGKHSISANKWTTDYGTPATDAIIYYNVINSFLIIQKPANDTWNPAKYQKIVLTQFNGSWYTCTLSPFDSATATAAAGIADSSVKTDPENSGCGGFSWTRMIP